MYTRRRGGAVEQFSQLVVPDGVRRSVTGDGLDEQKPVISAEPGVALGHAV